jgi:hypothetical protein
MAEKKFDDMVRENPDAFGGMDARPLRSAYTAKQREALLPEAARREMEKRGTLKRFLGLMEEAAE